MWSGLQLANDTGSFPDHDWSWSFYNYPETTRLSVETYNLPHKQSPEWSIWQQRNLWGEDLKLCLALKHGSHHLALKDQDVMRFPLISPLWTEGQMSTDRCGGGWWWGCYHLSMSKQGTCSWARRKRLARRAQIPGAFDFTNSSVETPSQEWQRSDGWLVPSLGDNSRQFYHPAVLFFKTKVIGIELQSFAKTLAISSAISQTAL